MASVKRKKVVVIGDGACGKTSLSVAFSKNEFPEEHIPTVYDTYTKTIEVDNEHVELIIWDTAGEEDYDRLRPLSYAGASVMLLCFAIDNPDSLINIREKWAIEVKHFCGKVPIVLVGTKMDLRNDNQTIKDLRKYNLKPVQYEQGMKMAKKIKALAYIECSAKHLIGVRDVFTKAAHITLESSNKKRTRCSCTKM